MSKPKSDEYELGFACGRYTTIEIYKDWMTTEFFHGYIAGMNQREEDRTSQEKKTVVTSERS
jgi:hypothetical protein